MWCSLVLTHKLVFSKPEALCVVHLTKHLQLVLNAYDVFLCII